MWTGGIPDLLIIAEERFLLAETCDGASGRPSVGSECGLCGVPPSLSPTTWSTTHLQSYTHDHHQTEEMLQPLQLRLHHRHHQDGGVRVGQCGRGPHVRPDRQSWPGGSGGPGLSPGHLSPGPSHLPPPRHGPRHQPGQALPPLDPLPLQPQLSQCPGGSLPVRSLPHD